ncbi:MAG: hypothetical protein LUC86_03820 [Prevotellaceae bacterium]|nr:hypothetical protein [Prevotellaceae bacterium]
MKRKLLILFSTLCLSTSVFGVGRVGVYTFFSASPSYQYEDENVTVVIYGMQLVIYNKTDHVIYLDKEASFAYLNGVPTSLFTNASYTNSKTKGGGASANLGGLASALGVKGPIGSVLGGVNVGGGVSYGSSTTYYEQKIVAIAPTSAYIAYRWESVVDILTEKGVINRRYIFPYTYHKTKFKKGLSWHFEDNTSPLCLMGVINYYNDQELQSPTQASVSKYMSDIVIGSYKGINSSPQCAPYKGQECRWFEKGVGKWVIWFCVGQGAVLLSAVACCGL